MYEQIADPIKNILLNENESSVHAAWLSRQLYEKYQVPHLMLALNEDDPRLQDELVAISFQNRCSAICQKPIEVWCYPKNYAPTPDDNAINVFGLPHGEFKISVHDDWFKGYWSAISAALALTCCDFNLFEESQQRLKNDLEKEQQEKGTSIQTMKCLLLMMDDLGKSLFVDFFTHDSATHQQYRRSSPFLWIMKEHKDVVESHLHDIVEHPENRPPMPSYDAWLNKLLEKGNTGSTMLRYIPKRYWGDLEVLEIPIRTF